MMKKRLISLILCFGMLVGGLVGCGGSEANNMETETSTEDISEEKDEIGAETSTENGAHQEDEIGTEESTQDTENNPEEIAPEDVLYSITPSELCSTVLDDFFTNWFKLMISYAFGNISIYIYRPELMIITCITFFFILLQINSFSVIFCCGFQERVRILE